MSNDTTFWVWRIATIALLLVDLGLLWKALIEAMEPARWAHGLQFAR